LQSAFKTARHAAKIEVIESTQSLGLSVKSGQRIDAQDAGLHEKPALRIAVSIGVEGDQGRISILLRAQRTYGSGEQPLLAQIFKRLFRRPKRCGWRG